MRRTCETNDQPASFPHRPRSGKRIHQHLAGVHSCALQIGTGGTLHASLSALGFTQLSFKSADARYGTFNRVPARVDSDVVGVGSGESLVSEQLLRNFANQQMLHFLGNFFNKQVVPRGAVSYQCEYSTLCVYRLCGCSMSSSSNCLDSPSIWLRFRQLFACLSASVDSRSDGVSHLDTESLQVVAQICSAASPEAGLVLLQSWFRLSGPWATTSTARAASFVGGGSIS